MTILISGGFGNVGRSTVRACMDQGHRVVVFERKSALKQAGRVISRLLKTEWRGCEVVFGDIRSREDVSRAFERCAPGPEAVIHLAAIIPPQADKDEAKTREINVDGTANIIEACKILPSKPRVVLASSVAIYGDRLDAPWIRVGDPLSPNDTYSKTKQTCESMLKESGLPFTILRLSYVVWAKWLPFDPLLFAMPPDTRLEVLHTDDSGRAFAAAATSADACCATYNLGGGALCRTTFRAFLDRVFRLYGLGDSSFLPASLFARGGFHCGWFLDSDLAESILHFRSKTLEDYYDEVGWEVRWIKPFASLARKGVRRWLAAKSPFRSPGHRGAATSSQARLRLSSQGRK